MSRDLFGELMTKDAADKKEKIRVRNKNLRKDAPSEVGKRSGDLQITGIYVDTSRRSVGVDKSAGKRTFVKKPQIVGYEVTNISDEPVAMKRRIYTASMDDPGSYACSDATFVLRSGEKVVLSKYDAARLFGGVEFGFTAANGYFTGSKSLEGDVKIEEYLASRYFVPRTPLSDRATHMINSQVGLRDVREDLLSIFAFLLEDKKSKKQKITSRCQMESLALAKYIEEHGEPDEATETTDVGEDAFYDALGGELLADDEDEDDTDADAGLDDEDLDDDLGEDDDDDDDEDYTDEDSLDDDDSEDWN